MFGSARSQFRHPEVRAFFGAPRRMNGPAAAACSSRGKVGAVALRGPRKKERGHLRVTGQSVVRAHRQIEPKAFWPNEANEEKFSNCNKVQSARCRPGGMWSR